MYLFENILLQYIQNYILYWRNACENIFICICVTWIFAWLFVFVFASMPENWLKRKRKENIYYSFQEQIRNFHLKLFLHAYVKVWLCFPYYILTLSYTYHIYILCVCMCVYSILYCDTISLCIILSNFPALIRLLWHHIYHIPFNSITIYLFYT